MDWIIAAGPLYDPFPPPQMKPLFSNTKKEVYHPGDPRRTEFEKRLRHAGGRPEEFENMVIETVNGDVAKVSIIFCCLECEMNSFTLHSSISVFPRSLLYRSLLSPCLPKP